MTYKYFTIKPKEEEEITEQLLKTQWRKNCRKSSS